MSKDTKEHLELPLESQELYSDSPITSPDKQKEKDDDHVKSGDEIPQEYILTGGEDELGANFIPGFEENDQQEERKKTLKKSLGKPIKKVIEYRSQTYGTEESNECASNKQAQPSLSDAKGNFSMVQDHH